MDFFNESWLAGLAFIIEDQGGHSYEVIVARGTFRLERMKEAERKASPGLTHVLVAEEVQPPLVVTDEYFGEVNKSSVRRESDLAQYKPKCDVVVIGSAHSPDGQPTPRVEVGIHVERREAVPGLEETGELLSRDLVVCGRRSFVRGEAARKAHLEGPEEDGFQLTEPEPFVEQPIRYEHAFGGENKVYIGEPAAERLPSEHRLSDEARLKHPQGAGAPIAHATCFWNPVGAGFLEKWYEDAAEVEVWPAPQIEAPGAALSLAEWRALVRGEKKPGETPALTPHGLGVITKAWQPRLALAGTFDEAWLSSKWPLMPDDFQMGYWNGAPATMQCPLLGGGEVVTLRNLLPPEGLLREGGAAVARFALPRWKVAVHLRGDEVPTGWVGMVVDTLEIDLEKSTVALVFRMAIRSDAVDEAILNAVEEEAREAS